MALRDYILCADCDCKLIYDGDDSAREWLEQRFGNPDYSDWTAEVVCPACLKKLRAENAALRAQLGPTMAVGRMVEDGQ